MKGDVGASGRERQKNFVSFCNLVKFLFWYLDENDNFLVRFVRFSKDFILQLQVVQLLAQDKEAGFFALEKVVILAGEIHRWLILPHQFDHIVCQFRDFLSRTVTEIIPVIYITKG